MMLFFAGMYGVGMVVNLILAIIFIILIDKVYVFWTPDYDKITLFIMSSWLGIAWMLLLAVVIFAITFDREVAKFIKSKGDK